jgi:hypothetical protein
MAKTKRQLGGRGSARRHPKPPREPLPDRRAIEGVLRQLAVGLRGEVTPDIPLGQAQGLV